MDFTGTEQYTNTYPTRYAVKPRQPNFGDIAVSTGSDSRICTYDLISPYGMGANVVSNPNQTTRYMVGWGLIVNVSLLPTIDLTMTVKADLFDGTFTELEFSPIAIALGTKIQTFTLNKINAFAIQVFIKAASVVGPTTIKYHTSLTDY